MARRSKNDNLIEAIPALAGIVLLPLLLVPGGQHLISAIGGLFVLTALLAVLAVVVFVIYRVAARPTRQEQDVSPSTPIRHDFLAPVSKASPTSARQLIQQLRAIDWYQFEQAVAIAYQKTGYQVERRGGANPDGGIDLILTSSAGERVAVQCKQWKTWNVGVRTIREFIGAMKIAGIQKGILITLQGYAGDAKKTAEGNGVELVNETGFAQLLESSDARFDPEVLELLNDTRKRCPKCEHELVLRTAAKGPKLGSKFWGCSTYPRCRYTLPCS